MRRSIIAYVESHHVSALHFNSSSGTVLVGLPGAWNQFFVLPSLMVSWKSLQWSPDEQIAMTTERPLLIRFSLTVAAYCSWSAWFRNASAHAFMISSTEEVEKLSKTCLAQRWMICGKHLICRSCMLKSMSHACNVFSKCCMHVSLLDALSIKRWPT